MEIRKKKDSKGEKEKKGTILVIGELCKDKFVYGRADRICPEAPVPVFKPTGDITINDGMAGNVASNIRGLGYDCHHIRNAGEITKTRYIDYKSNQMLLRVDDHDYAERIVLEGLNTPLISSADLVIVSDYNKGFLLEEDLAAIFKLNSNCFLDTKKRLKASWASGARFIKINESEYAETKDSVTKALARKLVVTWGDKGCVFRDKKYPPVEALQTIDVSGAGDTFIAGLAVKWYETRDMSQAIDFANLCAHAVIQERGVTFIKHNKLK